MSSVFREWQRRRLQARPFPEAWRSFLQTDFPLYNKLNTNDQQELEQAILVFLAEKTFEGCGGLELTDEIRVLIAAQACLLLLHRETDFYPNLSAILVYPYPYASVEQHYDPAGILGEHVSVRLGESWPTGTIVLAWSAVTKGAHRSLPDLRQPGAVGGAHFAGSSAIANAEADLVAATWHSIP